MPRAAAQIQVVERRAADLIVVGDSPEGCLAAYSSAKAGRKVILLPSFGLEVPAPAPAALHPVKVTHANPLLSHLAFEAAAYWRGLELLSDSKFLRACPTLDICLRPGDDSAAATAFSRLAASAAATGARAAALRPDQLPERLGPAVPLRLPPGAAALLQPDGGVLAAGDAAGAARALAERAGVHYKERLRLRGWRDAGGAFFRVEASTPLLPDAVSVFEAEQLLLAPGGGWAPEALRLFNLASELEVREVVSGAWLAGSEATTLPVWQLWAPPSADGPTGSPVPCFGLPAPPGVTAGRAAASELSWQGRLVSSGAAGSGGAFGWAPVDPRPAARALEASAGLILRDVSLQPTREDQEEEEEEQARRTEGGRGGGEGAGGGGGGGGGRKRGRPAARPRRRLRAQLLTACADGLPAVGYAPGFEAGRVAVCVAACGSTPGGDGGLPAFQFAPMVGKLAADLLLGRAAAPQPPQQQGKQQEQWRQQEPGAGGRSDSAAGRTLGGSSSSSSSEGGSAPPAAAGDGESSSLVGALWAARPAVGLRAHKAPPGGAIDTLTELGALQRRAGASAEEVERAADEAADQRADARGRE